MAKSSKNNAQRKIAKKKAKEQARAKAKAQARAKKQAYRLLQSTQQTNGLEKIIASIKQLCPTIPLATITQYLQSMNINTVPEELLPAIINQLPNVINVQPLDELYSNYPDLSDLIQDFQTLVENSYVQRQKTDSRELSDIPSLAFKYIKKTFSLLIDIAYIDLLLEYASDFTADIDKHTLNLQQTKLGRDITFICEQHKDIFTKIEDFLQQYFAGDIESIFFNIKQMIESQECKLPATSYQRYLQEMKDCVSNFVLQRAQIILNINNKYLQTEMNGEQLDHSLNQLAFEGIEDPTHILAQPFEAFISEENFTYIPYEQDLIRIYPEILKIQLKYTPRTLKHWCDILFKQSYENLSLEPEEFIAQMDNIQYERLEAMHKEQAKRVTFTVQNPQAPSQAPSKHEKQEEEEEKEQKQKQNVSSCSSKTEAKTTNAKTSSQATKSTKAAKTTQATKAPLTATTTATNKDLDNHVSLLSSSERHELLAALQAQNPHPQSELNYRNNFELLCSVVLSAQATDKSVNLVTPKLFAAAPTPQTMMALGAEGIAPYIQSIGLWRIKSKRLAMIAQILHENYHDEVPNDYAELLKLPGVGSKTAKVVLNVAFDKPYIAVDTHVFRVCNRTGLCLGKTPAQVEKNLPDLVEPQFIKDAHHYLLLHGRHVCTAKNFEGNCATCVAAKWCRYHKEHTTQ